MAVAVPALAIGPRDLRIVTAARAKLGTRVDFGDAVRALREAVERWQEPAGFYWGFATGDLPEARLLR